MTRSQKTELTKIWIEFIGTQSNFAKALSTDKIIVERAEIHLRDNKEWAKMNEFITKTLTPAQIKMLRCFAKSGTATVDELKSHYSFWRLPIESLRRKGFVVFNKIRMWWELTQIGGQYMPFVESFDNV